MEWRVEGEARRGASALAADSGAKLVLTLEATTSVLIARVSQGMCKRRETVARTSRFDKSMETPPRSRSCRAIGRSSFWGSQVSAQHEASLSQKESLPRRGSGTTSGKETNKILSTSQAWLLF